MKLNEHNCEQNFKKWFNQSKVTTIQSKPLVVFHGTLKEFFVFNTEPLDRPVFGLGANAIGSHFSESEEIGSSYPFSRPIASEPARVIKAYLSIQNPKKYFTIKSVQNDLLDFCETFNLNLDPWSRLQNVALFKNDLIEQGYDGITYLEGPSFNVSQNKKRVWVAFFPWQIKSIDNNGDFDSQKHDFRY